MLNCIQLFTNTFEVTMQVKRVHGRSLPLIYTEAGRLGGAAPQKLYTIFHKKIWTRNPNFSFK